jgi:hypothetical protein
MKKTDNPKIKIAFDGTFIVLIRERHCLYLSDPIKKKKGTTLDRVNTRIIISNE